MPRATASSPGKALARERALWLRERAANELKQIRAALQHARQRRKAALARAKSQCALARNSVRLKVRAYRSREMKRINATVREMRNAARAKCQARKHRIRVAGSNAVERRQRELRAESTLQRQLEHATRVSRRVRNTVIERRQESDDEVRSNLPRELLPVFERVRRHIKGNRRRTRTEAFLEWAEEHPEDVLDYQGDATEREVRRLVAEHEAAERRLAKAKRRAPRRKLASGDDEVPF